MCRGPTDAEKLRKLPWLYAHLGTNSLYAMLTLFGPVFLLFLDELQLDTAQIGSLLSLFPFCGIVAVFIGPTVTKLGIKRTYLVFWGARKLVTALLLLTPLVIAWYGQEATLYFVGGVVLIFALCRAVGETALFPWQHECIPNAVRGRVTGWSCMIVTAAELLAMLIASKILKLPGGLERFMWLFAIGLVAGLISVGLGVMIPGGRPVRGNGVEMMGLRATGGAIRDPQLRLYLIGQAIVTIGTGMLIIFLPLFWKGHVGLTLEQVVLLQVVACVSFLLGSMPWGWATDRFGSKPVMLVTLTVISLGLPFGLFLVPRHSPWSFAAAASLLFASGLVFSGWDIGQKRILNNSIVPPQHRTAYLSVHYAWIGIAGGLQPIIGGWILKLSDGLDHQWLGLTLDRYSPVIFVFAASGMMGVLVFSRLRIANETSTLSFAGLFIRGNPITAMGALINYNLAGDEIERVTTTARLGQTGSSLHVKELLDALADPSFNVRYEAIISIARARHDPVLTEALIEVLDGDEPDLSIAAAWALGRLHDRRAIQPLRRHLDSDYLLLAARCARALGMMGDQGSADALLVRLREQTDDGLRIAYGSALGMLRSRAAVPDLLTMLDHARSSSVRFELVLALARICGKEKPLVRLWRAVRTNRDTALSQTMVIMRRRLARFLPDDPQLPLLAQACSSRFADGDIEDGIDSLVQLVRRLPSHLVASPMDVILKESADQLSQCGNERIEYLLLVIDALGKVLQDRSKDGTSA